MNKITLSKSDFDALPEHQRGEELPLPEVGKQWRRLYRGVWFVAEYVKVVEGVIGIEFQEVEIIEETEAAQ